MGGIGIWQLLIILLIVIVLFGTKKLRNIGGDLGSAIKNFRSSMRDGESESEAETTKTASPSTPAQVTKDDDKGKIIEGQITDKQVNSNG